ncbi:MAG: hypothetical protein M1838_005741, partial [Thelocarpon superellum]
LSSLTSVGPVKVEEPEVESTKIKVEENPSDRPAAGSHTEMLPREDGRIGPRARRGPASTLTHLASPLYDLIISVYFDGQRTARRRLCVFLNPQNQSVRPTLGAVSMKRTLLELNGIVQQRGWAFKEAGIGTFLDGFVHGDDHVAQLSTQSPDEIELLYSMQLATLEQHRPRAKKDEVGNIAVILERVIVEARRLPLPGVGHDKNENLDVYVSGNSENVTTPRATLTGAPSNLQYRAIAEEPSESLGTTPNELLAAIDGDDLGAM